MGLKWQGLPNDAVILYGLLEIATDIVRDHFARHNAPKILVPNGPLPPFPSS